MYPPEVNPNINLRCLEYVDGDRGGEVTLIQKSQTSLSQAGKMSLLVTKRQSENEDRLPEQVNIRTKPLLAATCRQPGRLVPVGRGGFCQSEAGKQAYLSVNRLLDLPLVPRYGA